MTHYLNMEHLDSNIAPLKFRFCFQLLVSRNFADNVNKHIDRRLVGLVECAPAMGGGGPDIVESRGGE